MVGAGALGPPRAPEAPPANSCGGLRTARSEREGISGRGSCSRSQKSRQGGYGCWPRRRARVRVGVQVQQEAQGGDRGGRGFRRLAMCRARECASRRRCCCLPFGARCFWAGGAQHGRFQRSWEERSRVQRRCRCEAGNLGHRSGPGDLLPSVTYDFRAPRGSGRGGGCRPPRAVPRPAPAAGEGGGPRAPGPRAEPWGNFGVE